MDLAEWEKSQGRPSSRPQSPEVNPLAWTGEVNERCPHAVATNKPFWLGETIINQEQLLKQPRHFLQPLYLNVSAGSRLAL